MLRILLGRAKTDQFENVVFVCVSKTNTVLCPVAALLSYLAICTPAKGPLFIFRNSTPHIREFFVKEVRASLSAACINHQAYSGHSSRIREATMAADAGIAVHTIKMLGSWNSDAYQLYICNP